MCPVKMVPKSIKIGTTQAVGNDSNKPSFNTSELGVNWHDLVGTKSEDQALRFVLERQSRLFALFVRDRNSGEIVSRLGEPGVARVVGSLDYVLGGFRGVVEDEPNKYSEAIVKAVRLGITGAKRPGSDGTTGLQEQFTFIHVLMHHISMSHLYKMQEKQGRQLPRVQIIKNDLDSVYAIASLIGPVVEGGEAITAKAYGRPFTVNVGGELWVKPNPNYRDMVKHLRTHVNQQALSAKEDEPVEPDTADVTETEEPF